MVATLLAVLLLKFTLAMAQSIYSGPCPEGVEAIKDFDIKQYLGRWYEYARYSHEFDLQVKCAYDDLDLLQEGVILMKHTKFFVPNLYYCKILNLDVAGPGKLWMHPIRLPATVDDIPYWILGTDYKNYAVVYSCQETYIRFVLVLMRESTLTAEQIEKTQQILTNNSLGFLPLVKTNNTGCDDKI